MVALSHLEPNTTYEIRVAAVNGKGQGDYSKIEIFQTLPVRKYSFLFLFLLPFSISANLMGFLNASRYFNTLGK